MKMIIKITAIFLLVFNGVSALAGGYGLMSDPTGMHVGIPLNYLSLTPFTDFFIPGLLLFCSLGVMSLLVASAAMRSSKYSPYYIVFQGGVCMIWIIAQMILVRELHSLHLLYGLIAFVLILCGFYLLMPQSHRARVIPRF
ncbi:MAG: hypothetical protein V4642_11600 [Bacteroidota bacterium]